MSAITPIVLRSDATAAFLSKVGHSTKALPFIGRIPLFKTRPRPNVRDRCHHVGFFVWYHFVAVAVVPLILVVFIACPVGILVAAAKTETIVRAAENTPIISPSVFFFPVRY